MDFSGKKKTIVAFSVGAVTTLGLVFGIANKISKNDASQNSVDNTEVAVEEVSVDMPKSASTQKIELVKDDNVTKVQNGEITNEMALLRDEQIKKILEDNNLTAADLSNYKEAITKDVMAEIQTVLDHYESSLDDIEFIKGEKGKDGVDGKDGKNGTQGIAGSRGATGATGKSGINGKDGLNGKDGKNGVDGKSTYSYVVYADDYNGSTVTGFSNSKKSTSKYIGTCSTTESTGPSSSTYSSYDISWQKISDYVITYSADTNTVTISK